MSMFFLAQQAAGRVESYNMSVALERWPIYVLAGIVIEGMNY